MTGNNHDNTILAVFELRQNKQTNKNETKQNKKTKQKQKQKQNKTKQNIFDGNKWLCYNVNINSPIYFVLLTGDTKKESHTVKNIYT